MHESFKISLAILTIEWGIQSKGSVSQLMDDLDLIIEQVEVITVNSTQKGVENVLRKQCRLKTLLLL